MSFELNWLVLAIMAAFSWALVNILDKKILTGKKITIPARQVFDSVVGLLTVIALISYASSPNIMLIGLGMSGGLLIFAFNNYYYKSLQLGSVSAVSIHLQLIPIFSATIGFLLFGERFSGATYWGVTMIVAGAVLVSIERGVDGKFPIFLSRNMHILLRYMLPASLFMCINYGFNMELLTQNSILDVYLWGRVGTTLGGLGLYIFSAETRKACHTLVYKHENRLLCEIFTVELFNVIGIWLLTAAFAVGTITLVTIATSTQPLLVIIFLIAFAAFNRTDVLADFSASKRVLFLRITAVFLQIAGIFFLTGI